MRPLPFRRLSWGLLTLLLVALPAAQAKTPAKFVKKESDRADLRAKANLEMFGGHATPEYLDFKARVAEQELKRWERLIPGTKAHRMEYQMAGIPERAWTNIGPYRGQSQLYITDTNIADTGRPTVTLPHPTNLSTLYVGYAGGGLWRCSNADVAASGDWTWTPLTDALPAGSPAGNLSVGGAAFKVGDPNTIYLALGDMMPGSADSTAEGRGFFISTDGGDNWTRGGTLGATTRVKTVLALAGNVILVSGNAGLFRSIDGGTSFTAITSGPLVAGTMGWDIVKMANGDLVMAYQGTTASSSGVAYSADNGVTWIASTYDTTLTGFGFLRISLAANGATVYGLFEDGAGAFQKGIMKSTDSGRTWAWFGSTDLFNVDSDGNQAGYNHMIAVDPANVNTVFVGTNLSMYRTLNGGVSWERMTQWMGSDRHYIHADFHVHAWAPSGTKTFYVGTDGGLAVVRNPDIAPIPTGSGGVPSDPTFIDNRRNRNIATQLVYHIGSTTAATPAGAKDRVIVGLQDQGTRLRTESGVATQAYDLEIGGDGFGCLIHPYDGNKMLGSLYYSRIQRTTNGGSSWSSVTGITGSGSGTTAPFFTRLGQDMSDPTGNRVYTFTKTVPFVSTDFGANWTAMPVTGLTSPNPIRHIVASPLTPNHVAVALNGGRLGITTNGTSWTTIAGTAFPGSGSYMNCVAFDTADAQILYASSVAFSATSNHIWKSINGGTTWVAVDGTASTSNGFPFGVPVHMVKVDPIDHTTVYAGTDLGLYRSTDSGTTWTRFGTGLPLVSVRDIYIAPDGTFMRIGTHGRGVWEMQGVTANYAPQFSSQPQNVSVIESDSATVGAVAVGLPIPTYQWQQSTNGTDWSNITTNGTGNTYTISSTTLADNGKRFRVVATNSISAVTSSPATLTVTGASAPIFSIHPSAVTQIAGLRADFTGTATASPSPTYQWQSSPNGTTWTDITSATTNIYKFYPTSADANKRFRLRATNTAGSVDSNSATLTLTPNTIQLLANPDFEVTPLGTGWTWSDAGMFTQTAANVHEGATALYLCDWGEIRTDWGYQTVAIPANPASAGLTFWMKILNRAATPTTPNTMTVKVQSSTGADLATLATFDNATAGYSSHTKTPTYNMSAYAGQTVRLYFTSSQTDAANGTAFYVDDINLI
ncbi:MAG: hypothetical protein Q8O00_01410, partial [Holophaga sp.]|nr:hypothetical protein [Holophaga sp.]